MSQRGGTGYARDRNIWIKSCKESSVREIEIHTLLGSMIDDAKVGDGDEGNLKKTSKQLRKERDDENEVRALLEKMQQNLDEAHTKASEFERRLCQELEEWTYS